MRLAALPAQVSVAHLVGISVRVVEYLRVAMLTTPDHFKLVHVNS
jgi:hypothetical protein